MGFARGSAHDPAHGSGEGAARSAPPVHTARVIVVVVGDVVSAGVGLGLGVGIGIGIGIGVGVGAGVGIGIGVGVGVGVGIGVGVGVGVGIGIGIGIGIGVGRSPHATRPAPSQIRRHRSASSRPPARCCARTHRKPC